MNSLLTPLPDWDPAALAGSGIQLTRVETDSRRVGAGDVFLACRGEYADGRNYIAEALARGASAVLWDPADGFEWKDEWAVPNLAVPALRERAGMVAAYAYGLPSRALSVVGITGTNGKTSISHWLAQAYSLLGQKAALIGTVGNGFYGELTETTHTTPDPVTVQQRLAEYQRQGANVVTMEVSSHGLDQFRVNGVEFDTAVFTNLTRDHLDYHGSMAAYGASKARLFHWEGLKHAVINADDEFGRELAAGIDAARTRVIRFGLEQGDVRPLSLAANLDGLQMRVTTPWGEGEIRSPLLGRFNASNMLACLATLCAGGVALADACDVLGRIKPARGRMQRVGGEHEPLIVVDYAHTPDALDKAATTLAEIRPQGSRLFVVFGCGGDRDSGKRPMMGAIAERVADVAVVTSDNPRTEDPQVILNDIVAGMQAPGHIEIDRAQAIAWAVAQARAGDIVLIAGKGHEEYQDVMGIKHAFSDFRVAEDALTVWGQAHADAV
ncbi:UDP-N-acetylmuramoyl-L-alanyl-D-glutamate--2,6-diaminopimelate ligase [Craterilacuibacter sinensis]|uniref:UDP-N-acetylmuramoyl-L-alanyl-D-glutamate--2,6-diaminopimelate ligase n=1 Tax=Craterilacuibacter sinensis TaxID=2686017 RepID=A0A845BVC1_9NEIS|nr:UDP-N-acetylmuramoyl-L-alanyl-D-glutamate--2,6-diaminopimelate ligase [Craterilacuibacter sinensis]MXR36463.1 UDP-N-acetylmuramoyl-L-alanyl-D-glutamate--2,6-diaminopimelate ligase [Craterilacuibacter sinensis]RQW28519.1 UDP-N-acetylmuramoyl-L-alanyl-D-glutamate--2,6-diaminopimelate ligase [Rhodobacteraceae bacterium CH30]